MEFFAHAFSSSVFLPEFLAVSEQVDLSMNRILGTDTHLVQVLARAERYILER